MTQVPSPAIVPPAATPAVQELFAMESTPDDPRPATDPGSGEAPPRRRRRRRRRGGGGGQPGGGAATEGAPAADVGSGDDAPESNDAEAVEEPLDGETAATAEPGVDAGGPSAPGGAPGEGMGRRRRRRRRRRGLGGAMQGGPGAPTASGEPGRAPSPPPVEEPVEIEVREGIVDLGGFGGQEPRLRQFSNGLVASHDDPWIPGAIAAEAKLRPCHRIRGEFARRAGSSRVVLRNVLEVEGIPLAEHVGRPAFADLVPLDPQPRMALEFPGCPPANRLIDLFCPIGFGTRGLVVAPPKAGKTILLKDMAAGIKRNHPQVELIALLIDERPEEVTDFRRNVPAQVLASSNDQDLEMHLRLGIEAIDRAKRLLEAGRDVVVLLDSLTRLGRAFNNSRRYGSGGRTMSGGLDSRALEVPKQLFGAARKAEQGGSLTIIASCLVDTGSRADQIIFEEFKGTGNMELILDRSISEKRVFPAINLAASGTRKEHLLLSERELKTITALRRRLLSLPPAVQIEQLLAALKRFDTNERLVAG